MANNCDESNEEPQLPKQRMTVLRNDHILTFCEVFEKWSYPHILWGVREMIISSRSVRCSRNDHILTFCEVFKKWSYPHILWGVRELIISSRSVRCSKPPSILEILTAYTLPSFSHFVAHWRPSQKHMPHLLSVTCRFKGNWVHTRRTLRMHTPSTYLKVALLSVSPSLMIVTRVQTVVLNMERHACHFIQSMHTYNPFHLCQHTIVSKIESQLRKLLLPAVVFVTCYWTLNVQMYRTTGGIIGANSKRGRFGPCAYDWVDLCVY